MPAFPLAPTNLAALYTGFDTPLADLDCGQKCAPYNGGIPVCCDIHHAVPTAYPGEWIHLRTRTDLWQVWHPENKTHRAEIQADAGDLILLECLMLTGTQHPDPSVQESGNEPDRANDSSPAQSPVLSGEISPVEVKEAAHDTTPRTLRLREASAQGATAVEPYCRRDLRTLVCRAFPFFPYFDSQDNLLGLSVYWEYADRCWVISNLQIVRHEYRTQFIQTYENIFAQIPAEREAFQYHSAEMRRIFQERRRTLPLLHRDGYTYKISPATEKMHRIKPESFPKYGPYKIADVLLFPDEEIVHR